MQYLNVFGLNSTIFNREMGSIFGFLLCLNIGIHGKLLLKYYTSKVLLLKYYTSKVLLLKYYTSASYDVSGQGPVDVESWGRSLTEGSQGEKSYTKDYVWHEYDPCLYHVLFMNTGTFQTDLNYYTDLFKLLEGNTIGFHFQTGDLNAFGVENKDIRAQGQSLEASYNKMVSCTEVLAQKLSLDQGVNRKYNFFLATDNQHVKDMATNDERFDIHRTKEKLSPYLNSDRDRTAYLDLYLLSQTQGLALNVLPDTYDGPAERVSMFARLSWNIGFMNNKQLYECKIG